MKGISVTKILLKYKILNVKITNYVPAKSKESFLATSEGGGVWI
jgi:hypothetical protein